MCENELDAGAAVQKLLSWMGPHFTGWQQVCDMLSSVNCVQHQPGTAW